MNKNHTPCDVITRITARFSSRTISNSHYRSHTRPLFSKYNVLKGVLHLIPKISCGNHNSIVSHIQGIIRCRVVVRCIDMDVSFYKKKVHMSEKHTKLKVLTKIIIYPESLNALVSICPFNIPIGGVFSTKKEL